MENITPIVYPLEFTKNDDWIRDIKVWADNNKTIPFPFDANWSAIMQVKKRSYGNPVIAEFKTSDISMVLSAGNIALNRAKSLNDISGDTYVYDIEFKDQNDKNQTLFETSDFLVKPEISDGSGL